MLLQPAGLQELPTEFHAKTRVIYQSAPPLALARKSTLRLRVLMVGHLRDEKDPLTFLEAAAICADQRMLFEQIGAALQPELGQAALAAQAALPAYRWLGGLPRAQTRQHIKRAHLLVNSSLMEGGAQVILEAVQSGTPVLASFISGNIGMLGADYAGYFPVGDADALARLLKRCAAEAGFLALLEKQCQQRAPLFSPQTEKRLVINLVQSALRLP